MALVHEAKKSHFSEEVGLSILVFGRTLYHHRRLLAKNRLDQSSSELRYMPPEISGLGRLVRELLERCGR